MVLKLRLLFQPVQKFSTVTLLGRRGSMMNNKIFFRYIENEERVDVNFMLQVNEGKLRQFNLSRKPSEPLQNVTTRISVNVQKVVNKALKKKKGREESPDLIATFVDCHDISIPETLTCLQLFSYQSGVRLKILDAVLEAVFNPPWVVNVSLPKSILAGFPVHPEYFVTQFADVKFNIFKWYTASTTNEKGNEIVPSHIKWELVGSGIFYEPSCNDIGKKLKLECIPGNESCQGPAVEVVAQNIVEAGPGKCPFETRHLFTVNKLKGKSFRCISYNILADLYADSDFTRTVLHPYCPPYALQMDYRKQLIVKELLGYNSDIMCLQEVDSKIFTHCLQSFFNLNQMEGLFYKKGKEVAEGLALFYRADRFTKVFDSHIVLSEKLQTEQYFEPIWTAIKNNEQLLKRLLDRSTVCSVTLLESRENPDQLLLVGNTHLYFHPNADHIRLIQGGMFIYWLKSILNETREKMPNKKVSMIMCGDFNSVPSCGIYRLYTTGCAPDDLPDWNSCEEESVSNLTLTQDIPLGSACGTPKYTNFTAEFADCLDYIFYDTSALTVDQVVPFPTVEELQSNTALPSIVFPSDHIALIADLSFQK